MSHPYITAGMYAIQTGFADENRKINTCILMNLPDFYEGNIGQASSVMGGQPVRGSQDLEEVFSGYDFQPGELRLW